MPNPKGLNGRAVVELFTDRKGEHRWRLRAPNGRLIATAGEGFTRPTDAKRSFLRAQAAMVRAVLLP